MIGSPFIAFCIRLALVLTLALGAAMAPGKGVAAPCAETGCSAQL